MKTFILSALIVLGLAASAHAVEVDCLFPSADNASLPCPVNGTSDGEIRLAGSVVDWQTESEGDSEPASVEVDDDAEGYEQRVRERIVEEGGCDADVLPHFYAAGCFNHATKRPSHIPVGASDGGE